MGLVDLVEKYKQDENELRLLIICETYGKKATAKNIKALKMLILDGDLDTLKLFLGDSDAIKAEDDKEIERQLREEALKPPNTDDFEIFVKKQFGDPADPNSLGNKVLTGQTYTWHMRSHIKPDVLMDKFARLAGKDTVQLDYHPSFKSNPPVWEVCILGTKSINRDLWTRVDQ